MQQCQKDICSPFDTDSEDAKGEQILKKIKYQKRIFSLTN